MSGTDLRERRRRSLSDGCGSVRQAQVPEPAERRCHAISPAGAGGGTKREPSTEGSIIVGRPAEDGDSDIPFSTSRTSSNLCVRSLVRKSTEPGGPWSGSRDSAHTTPGPTRRTLLQKRAHALYRIGFLCKCDEQLRFSRQRRRRTVHQACRASNASCRQPHVGSGLDNISGHFHGASRTSSRGTARLHTDLPLLAQRVGVLRARFCSPRRSIAELLAHPKELQEARTVYGSVIVHGVATESARHST